MNHKKASKTGGFVYFVDDLLGLSDEWLPGVLLLSLCRWSSFPVDFAVRFGPGLRLLIYYSFKNFEINIWSS